MFFQFFLLSIFLDASQIQIIFPFLATIYAQKLVLIICICGVLLDKQLISNIRNNLAEGYGGILLFVVIWMILSIPYGVFPGQSISFLIQDYWKVLLVFLLTLAYIPSKAELNKVIWVYIISVGVLVMLILKESDASRMALNEDIFDANDTAFMLLLALPFAFWKFKSTLGLKRLITFVICLLLIIAVIKTNSRGGFLGLISVFFVMLMQVKYYEKIGIIKILFILFFIGGAVFYISGPEYHDRISTIFNPSTDYNVSSTSGRTQIWLRGIDMMLSNPLLGVGVYNFISADGMLYAETGAHYQAAHNSFIQIGAELGFPGFIAFCLLIFGSIKKLRIIILKHRAIDDKDNFILVTAYSLLSSWVVYVVCGFFLSAAYVSSFYFLLALTIVLLKIEMTSDIDNKRNNIK